MVVLPLEMAKAIIEPIQGHSIFDLKDNADNETVDRLNKALNRQDGEEEDDDKGKKRKLKVDSEPPVPETQPVTPVHPPRRVSAKKTALTRAQLKTKLQKTGAFDLRTNEVLNWDSRPVKDSNIDKVLDFAYGSGGKATAGARQVAQRVRMLEVKDLPNPAFVRLMTTPAPRATRSRPDSTSTPQVTRRVTAGWTKF